MESPENESAVFRPSHQPWKSIKPIPTFPPPGQRRGIYEKIPKRSPPKLPASNRPLRLILGLEKTTNYLPHQSVRLPPVSIFAATRPTPRSMALTGQRPSAPGKKMSPLRRTSGR